MDKAKVQHEFDQAVNMSAEELEEWLETAESQRVGCRRPDCSESVGHASGRDIVRILRTPGTRLDDEDYLHMRKVVGYVHRHRAQRPANIYTSRWRYSLMNWGHDPVKEDER